MNSKENNVYRIYTKRIAIELRRRGFKIIGTDVNLRFPQFDVYLFEDTPEFREELKKFMN